MKGLGFTIGDPLEQLPPPAVVGKTNDHGWSAAYRATRLARGQWVPITCGDRAQARNLSLVARRRHRFEATIRGAVCYLRWPR